nr:unnamed protein product [Digitaria exilis]
MATVRSTLPANLPPPPSSSPPARTATPSYHRKPLATSPAEHAALQPSEAASLLTAAARARDLRLGRAVHARLLRTGTHLETDTVVANSLLTLYSKCGAVDAARSVFDGMPPGLRDLVSWTAMASCLARNGVEDEALRLFGETLQAGLRPNAFTMCAAAQACFVSELFHSAGHAVLGLVFKTGLWGTDVSVGCALIDMFAKNGDMVAASLVFDGLVERTVVVWTLLITRYAQGGYADGAVDLFVDMLENGFRPDQYTMSSMLSACAELGSYRLGQQLHSLVLRLGLVSDSCVSCGLVDMYAKSQIGPSMHNARKVFDRMSKHNVMSWTALLSGCGYLEDACRAFDEMNDHNVISWTSMISGLAKHGHAGLVKEGKEHFRMMQKDHWLAPRMEHYACMVDLLGRSGLVEEALDFINEMPCKADALVWKTLLGACKTHNNMNIGEIAANHVIELEPQDPAPYVLLSNLYADAGLWDQVARIRSAMRDKYLMKETGLSWMYVENTIHEFRAGDTCHPQAEEIYTKLDRLIRDIKGIGYVPDTSIVLHDMPDELKERCLLQHSEKIAVAFGLISCTSATKPIRIFKNLRVCADCHSALKFVSKATGREIILRDSNRFHRMKDGKCSCGEYW